MNKIQPGLTGEAALVVEEKHTAHHLGSIGVHVLSTAVLIALMEQAARDLIDPLLEATQLTVGTAVNIKHLAATPVGRRVTARAELLAVRGRHLTFAVAAYDGDTQIGAGTHSRAIIRLARFLARLPRHASGKTS